MVALLDAHRQSRPDKTQVYKLWEALRMAKIVPEGDMMKELIIAGARVGNVKGRHADPREEVTPIEAEGFGGRRSERDPLGRSTAKRLPTAAPSR